MAFVSVVVYSYNKKNKSNKNKIINAFVCTHLEYNNVGFHDCSIASAPTCEI